MTAFCHMRTLVIVNGCNLQVAVDEAVDEMASYFNRETVPKIIITTSDRPSQVRYLFVLYKGFKGPLRLFIQCQEQQAPRPLQPHSLYVGLELEGRLTELFSYVV